MSTPSDGGDFLDQLTSQMTGPPSGPRTVDPLTGPLGDSPSAHAPIANFKGYVTDYVSGGGQMSMDPDAMRAAIAECNAHVHRLRVLQQRASNELYVESLGIGEDGFEPARQLLMKYQHKARGGGSIPQDSSAVGYIASLINWMNDFRDGLQFAVDAYVATDNATGAALGTIETDS